MSAVADDADTNGGTQAGGHRPLEGVRVVEVSYGAVAPFAARYLAVLGADVIRVESRRRKDGIREAGSPWLPDNLPPGVHLDISPILELVNGSKRSVVFELDTTGGYAAFLQLIRTADIFLTNLAPPVLQKLKLAATDLAPENPALIYLATSTFGDCDAGEFREHRTWGHNVGAFSGLSALTGWPEDRPLLWPFNYTDFMCALFGAFLALGALAKRRRSGEGVEMDLAIHELVAAALGEDFERCLNGEEELTRQGNDDPDYLAQGVFALEGNDRWLALTLRDEDDWRRTREAFGICDAPGDREAIHERLAGLLSGMTDAHVRSLLASAQLPWEIVGNSEDVAADPRLQRDGYWQLLPHFRLGVDLVSSLPFIWDGRRLGDKATTPAFGQHTECILEEIGFSKAEAGELLASGDVTAVASPEAHAGPRPWLLVRPLPLGLSVENNE